MQLRLVFYCKHWLYVNFTVKSTKTTNHLENTSALIQTNINIENKFQLSNEVFLLIYTIFDLHEGYLH